MKKKFPKIKKKIIDFIKEEDAKVVHKTTAKIALTISFISFNLSLFANDANAIFSHSSHRQHANDYDRRYYDIDNTNSEFQNIPIVYFGAEPIDIAGETMTPKSVISMHSHHWNHSSGC